MRFLLVLAAVTSLSTGASAQARQAMPSGRGMTQVTLSDPRENPPDRLAPQVITIDYGVPHLRGRTLHTENLVPLDRPWRTGANAATTLTTEADLTLGGAAVPKGTYYILTHPSQAGWKLSLHSADPLQNPNAPEVARIDLRRRELPMSVESLTITLIPVQGAARGELRLAWGNVELSTDWAVR